MSTVEEIKAAIDRLSFEERARPERMLHGRADDDWDRRIASDASSRRLDKLLSDVDRETDAGEQRDLP